MKTKLLLLFCLVPLLTMSQKKTFDIALSYGGYTSTMFYQDQFKWYFSADFEYHLTNRWTISSGFMKGTFGYFDGFPVKLANGTYAAIDEPNAQAFDFHGDAVVKYAVVASPRFTLQLGAGLGMYTQLFRYAYEGYIYESGTIADFEVPVTIEGFYLIAGRVGIGVKGGCFVQPDVRGIHVGPQIRIRL